MFVIRKLLLRLICYLCFRNHYRNAKRRVESRLELAAAEGLEMMLDAADVFVQTRYNAEAANCIIS